MVGLTIKRCPVCPNIGRRAREVALTLYANEGLQARIEDGVKGEFSVFVGDVPMIQRNGDSLPSLREVEAAAWKTAPAPIGV